MTNSVEAIKVVKASRLLKTSLKLKQSVIKVSNSLNIMDVLYNACSNMPM
jgi:hypothetical protein